MESHIIRLMTVSKDMILPMKITDSDTSDNEESVTESIIDEELRAPRPPLPMKLPPKVMQVMYYIKHYEAKMAYVNIVSSSENINMNHLMRRWKGWFLRMTWRQLTMG